MDFVGRFENFQEDFRHVGQEIDIDLSDIPWMNRTKHRHYSEYYTSKTRAKVEEIFRRDIDYFDYRFEYPASELR